jgi:putative transposase
MLNHAQYPSDVIAVVVLWRLRYKLSLRDLAELFLTRGLVFSYDAVRDYEAVLDRSTRLAQRHGILDRRRDTGGDRARERSRTGCAKDNTATRAGFIQVSIYPDGGNSLVC